MKNEKRNNNKRRLLLLILLLALTMILIGTSTYAWFTSNKSVNVDDLNVNVRAVNGLEISADATYTSWGVKIDKDDINEAVFTGQINQMPDSFGHVSTVGNIASSTGLIQMFDGSVATNCPGGGTNCDNPTYTLTTSEASEQRCYDSDSTGSANTNATIPKCSSVDAHFMAFDIFLKVDKANTKLYLSPNASVINTSADDLGIKNTVRVAFLVQGNINSTAYRAENGVEDAQALKTHEQVVIWEPNSNAHTPAGIASARTFYNKDISATSVVDYEGVYAGFSNPVPLTATNSTANSDKFKAIDSSVVNFFTTPVTNNARVDTGITLNDGVTKIRVYWWVEGNDVDTENIATGSDMRLNLEFTID